jgi:hypothetical protein
MVLTEVKECHDQQGYQRTTGIIASQTIKFVILQYAEQMDRGYSQDLV